MKNPISTIQSLKLCLIILFVAPFLVQAQQKLPEEALQQFARYPQERIFIQFDKEKYISGETIRFRTYVFYKYSLSRISTNLYVELIDEQKKVVKKELFPISGGITEGSLELPNDLAENIYYFRAYTSWMLNFDERFQYLEPIAVYNSKSPQKIAEQNSVWEAELFPEGGFLLDNTEANVTVRLNSLGGLPASWSGFLYEGSSPDVVLTEFQSLTEEVGFFSFSPIFGEKYFVKVTDNKGVSATLTLPDVKQSGIILNTAVQPTRIAFRISSNNLPNQLQGYKILAHIQGEMLYSAVIRGGSDEINGTIPLEAGDRGLVHLTLFDPAGKAVSERLCFASGREQTFLEPTLNTISSSNEGRGKNVWEMAIDPDYTNAYTVLISSDDRNRHSNIPDLLNVFWLDGIHSKTGKLGKYFKPENKKALDVLLVSEKWNLFNWNDLLNNTLPKMEIFPDNFLSYTGIVNQKNNLFSRTKPLLNDTVTILFQMNDSSSMFTQINTDSTGRFLLKNVVFYDLAKVYYHVTKKLADAIKIDVELEPIEHVMPFKGLLPEHGFSLVQRAPGDTVPEWMKNSQSTDLFLTKLNERHILLDSIVVTARAIPPKERLNRSLSSVTFQSPDEIVFDFINEEQSLTYSVFDFLHSRVPGLTHNGGNDITIRGEKPVAFIDEFMDDENYSFLNSISISEIAMVKVIRNSAMIPFANFKPVIAVYLKRAGQYSPYSNKPDIPHKLLYGYSIAKKMQEVNYDDPSQKNTVGYDTRDVLLWQTAFTPDKEKAELKFFNNDISEKIKLSVVGFTPKGLPVYLEKTMDLKK